MDELTLIEGFLREKRRLTKSLENITIKQYKRVLNSFWKLRAEQYGIELHKFTTEQLENIIDAMLAKGYAAKSINYYYTILNSYYSYLVEKKLLSENIVHSIKLPPIPPRIISYLYNDEWQLFIHQLMNVLDNTRPDYFQEIMLMFLPIATGIRCIEESRLPIQAFDFQDGTLRVIGKGNKERIIPISSPFLKEMLEKLFRERSLRLKFLKQELETRIMSKEQAGRDTSVLKQQLLEIQDFPYLFLNQNGKRVGVRDIQRRMKKYRELLHLTKPITPHKSRHTFASVSRELGFDVLEIQSMLGHSSIATTERYLHNDIRQLKAKADKIMPFSFNNA